MKRILLLLITIATLSLSSFAQAPEGFSYQAVIRNSANLTLDNTTVGMQLKIREASITGPVVYTETFAKSTNAYGLVSLEIGTGTTTDNFSAIAWATNGPFFIETAVDETGGTTYVVMGTSQLMSVAYALYAKTSGNGAGPQGAAGADGIDGTDGNDGADGAPGTAAPGGTIIRLMIQNGNTSFTNTDLFSADLSGLDLSGVDFSGSVFTGVSSGNVTGNPVLPTGYSIINGYVVGPGVNLTNADLTFQNLTGIDLSGADLTGTNLAGANMTNATIPSAFANVKKIEIRKSLGGHQTIRAMHFIVSGNNGNFDAARPNYATASTTNTNHQSPNFGGARDIIHMIGNDKTNSNNYTYNGGDIGTITFNSPYNISNFKEMTIYGWVQYGGNYYSRIASTQYILYTENNVKIYDFTTPAQHSNGSQKAIYRVIGPGGVSNGSIWTTDANGHFSAMGYSGGHYPLDILISPLVTVGN